jgi:hypothetical protein
VKWLRKVFRMPEPPRPITQKDLEFVRSLGYQHGLAEGELRGRLELAKELEIAYGIDSGHDLTEEQVRNIRLRHRQ